MSMNIGRDVKERKYICNIHKVSYYIFYGYKNAETQDNIGST